MYTVSRSRISASMALPMPAPSAPMRTIGPTAPRQFSHGSVNRHRKRPDATPAAAPMMAPFSTESLRRRSTRTVACAASRCAAASAADASVARGSAAAVDGSGVCAAASGAHDSRTRIRTKRSSWRTAVYVPMVCRRVPLAGNAPTARNPAHALGRQHPEGVLAAGTVVRRDGRNHMTDPPEEPARSDPQPGRDDQPENPPQEIAVVELAEAGNDRAEHGRDARVLDLRHLLHSWRQLHDPDVAEMDLRTFRFEAEIALLLCRPAHAVHEHAVHRELHDTVDGDDVVRVPFAPSSGAVLDRHAALAARIVRDGLDAADAEQFSVHVGDWRHAAVTGIQLRPVQFQHLDLDAVGQPRLGVRLCRAPDEHARVAARLGMHPFDVEHEVLVLLFTAHDADRASRADQY